MAQEWGSEMTWASKLAAVFYRFPKLGYELGVKHPSGGKTMMNVFTGKSSYAQVAQRGINLLTKSATSFLSR